MYNIEFGLISLKLIKIPIFIYKQVGLRFLRQLAHVIRKLHKLNRNQALKHAFRECSHVFRNIALICLWQLFEVQCVIFLIAFELEDIFLNDYVNIASVFRGMRLDCRTVHNLQFHSEHVYVVFCRSFLLYMRRDGQKYSSRLFPRVCQKSEAVYLTASTSVHK